MSISGRRDRARGFSLVELMVSAAIVGVLASVAMSIAETTVRRQKEHALRLALQDMRQAIDAYKQAAADKRILVLPGSSGYPHTLTELVDGVPDASNPAAPPLYFLRRVPRDPFSADQSGAPADSWGLRSYASPADRPRAGDDVYDVFSRSTETGLNGVPYGEW